MNSGRTTWNRWCCLALLAGLCWAVPSLAAGAVASSTTAAVASTAAKNTGIYTAASNTNYIATPSMTGLLVTGGIHDFSITAYGICRFIDVDAAALTGKAAKGVFIPFRSAAEWAGTAGSKGFLATIKGNLQAKVDLCRQAEVLGNVDYTGTGGITNPLLLATGQATTLPGGTSAFGRIDTRSEADFATSLSYTPPAVAFSLQRQDCLGVTVYPDHTTKNPCTTWKWVEYVTTTFTKDIGLTRAQAAAAAMTPTKHEAGTWSVSLKHTCSGPTGSNAAGETLVATSCPPAIAPPLLRNCAPQQHNTQYWQDQPVSRNNQRALHDCAAGQSENPARVQIFDTYQQVWCFDGKEYPLDQKDVVTGTQGQCIANPVDGVCGTTTGTGNRTVGQCLTPGATNAGDTAQQADGTYGWTCPGLNGGHPATCKSNCAATDSAVTLACAAIGLAGNGSAQAIHHSDVCTAPTCTGGMEWNGSACACAGNTIWSGSACIAPPVVTPPVVVTPPIVTPPVVTPAPTCETRSGWTAWSLWAQHVGTNCIERDFHEERWCDGAKVDDHITNAQKQCDCPAGQLWDGQACAADQTCPGNQVWNGSSCGCPVGQGLVGQTCQVVESCTTKVGWTDWAAWGGCIGGQERDQHTARICNGAVSSDAITGHETRCGQ